MYVLNPKSVTIGELYGEVNTLSNEWHDGLLAIIVRNACSVSEIIVFQLKYVSDRIECLTCLKFYLK